jgi:hypothetical protein
MPDYRPSRLQGRTACDSQSPTYPALILVMLVWGVASEALRDIITGFLDQVRVD